MTRTKREHIMHGVKTCIWYTAGAIFAGEVTLMVIYAMGGLR